MTEMSPAEQVYFAALEKATPAERAAYLDGACAGQPELRARVEKLLAAQPRVGNFLEPGTATGAFVQPDEQPGVVIAGRYKLLEAIGEGGMGTVWVAEQTEPVRRRVAVKLIKAGMDSKSVLARFEAERQALAVMDHPNIAKVLDGGLTETGRPFFVMEYVKGVPITEFCDATRLSVPQRLELFVQVCSAVQHAHLKGIIHRDLKPSNILVAPYDDRPVPKVIDFGLAKAMHQPLTERTLYTAHETVLGTPRYMSPEQAQLNNLDVDTRSDVYSLGVLLYELLTGTTPLEKQRFREAAWEEIKRLIREEEPPRPSTRLSTSDALPSLAAGRQIEPARLTKLVRGELDWIVMKALEKDRNRRYETANGLAMDVRRHLTGEPVLAVPPSAGYRLRKFARRYRPQVIVASLVFLVLLAGMAGTTFGLIRAEQARRDEAVQRLIAQEKEREALKAADEERRAKEREAAQRAIAVEQRTRAEKARDRTRDVLDAMTSSATGDSLGTQTEISADQKKFLTEVLTYYREFAGEQADDEHTRARTARAAFRVGLIEFRLGRREQGIAAFQTARDGYRTLAADFPAVPDYRLDQADSHTNMGILLKDLGNRAAAEEQYRQALAIREKLAADFPAVPVYRRQLAFSHNSLGILLRDLGNRAEAEERFRQALAIREKVVGDFPDVPGYRQALAVSHTNLGNLLADLGNRAEAREQHGRALAIREKLAADHPAAPNYRQELALTHTNLGNLLRDMGNRTDALNQYRQAQAIQEKLAADFPTVPDFRKALANSSSNLALLLADMGNRAEAEEQYRKALVNQEKLAADFPAVPDYRQFLAFSHNNLGILFKDQGKRVEAEEQYRRALAIQEKLAADFPAVTDFQIGLGGMYANYGESVRLGGRVNDSLGWFDRAVATLAPVHRAEPRDVKARFALRTSYILRARAFDALTKHAEALTDWDRAIEISSPAAQLTPRVSRATSRLQAGLVAEAVADVAEMTKSSNLTFGHWYDFACVYAVASGKIADRKREYADRAMESLQKAVQAGYKDVAHMKKDPDLDPLRGREDFKKLLADLEAKSPPKPEPAPPPRERK